MKDKDIYLLLGGTGVGKSTTIHFLCGSTMIMTKDGELSHITYSKLDPDMSEEDRKLLENVETSAKAVSCTQFIKAINIRYND